ncbi:MAG: chondroitinase-B domain-containing protein [Myxococcota bacterium]
MRQRRRVFRAIPLSAVTIVLTYSVNCTSTPNLNNRPCPCDTGWSCCERLQICLPDGDVCGATYFVSPSGNDANDGLSATTPWESFETAWPAMLPGDTLVLLDGVYTRQLNIAISGAEGSPITVRAQNDGGAIIDGENIRVPCRFGGNANNPSQYLHVEGLSCRRGLDITVFVVYTTHSVVRRVTGADVVQDDRAPTIFSFWHADDLLVEDVAASGQGTHLFSSLESDNMTFRRCWGKWVSANDPGTVQTQPIPWHPTL